MEIKIEKKYSGSQIRILTDSGLVSDHICDQMYAGEVVESFLSAATEIIRLYNLDKDQISTSFLESLGYDLRIQQTPRTIPFSEHFE